MNEAVGVVGEWGWEWQGASQRIVEEEDRLEIRKAREVGQRARELVRVHRQRGEFRQGGERRDGAVHAVAGDVEVDKIDELADVRRQRTGEVVAVELERGERRGAEKTRRECAREAILAERDDFQRGEAAQLRDDGAIDVAVDQHQSREVREQTELRDERRADEGRQRHLQCREVHQIADSR